jgi:PEP-CTERM motif
MRILAFVAIAASALALTGAAHAAPIAGLYDTGVTNTGAQAPNGIDSHWTLDGGNAFISGVQGTFPLDGPWLNENTDTASRWITPSSDAGESVDPRNDGFYQYSLTFDLSPAEAASASFLGQFAADNGIEWIKLNGTAILGSEGGTPIGGFSSWTNFAASSDFHAGANTLTFDVVNFGQATGNPSGLRVEFLSSNAVPEPASWALMIGGFGLTGAALRRRRRLAVATA